MKQTLLILIFLFSSDFLYSQVDSLNVNLLFGLKYSLPIDNIQKIYFGTATSVKSDDSEKLEIKSIFPNPSSSNITINFNIPTNGNVSIKIYNEVGELVKQFQNTEYQAGNNTLIWDKLNDANQTVASGTFIVELVFNGKSTTDKIIIIN